MFPLLHASEMTPMNKDQAYGAVTWIYRGIIIVGLNILLFGGNFAFGRLALSLDRIEATMAGFEHRLTVLETRREMFR